MFYWRSEARHASSFKYTYEVRNKAMTAENGAIDSFLLSTKKYKTAEFRSVDISSSLLPARYGPGEVSQVLGPPLFPTFQPILPPLPTTVQVSLTIVYIVVFSLIFVLVYIQLWMIWYYRHKRLSHQTLFLFMCLIWAGLRTSLFSFYFKSSVEAKELNIALYWLLYSLPVCLQFSMLCLLLHFFAQVVLKARAHHEPRQSLYPLHIFIGISVLLFIIVNIVCAVLTRQHELPFAFIPLYLIYIRVILIETMFLVHGVLLSVAIFKMTKMASSRRALEAQDTTVCKAVVATILITLLFLSRTVYNLISVCSAVKGTPNFGFDWINVTDQADVVSKLSVSMAYVSFGLVLFVWEVLPISIVVILFRVRRLTAGQVLTDFSSQIDGPRVFFFDNPRRYDSEDDLISQPSSGYLDTTDSHSYSFSSSHSVTPGRMPISHGCLLPTEELSNLPNMSSFLNYKGVTDYGAVNGQRFTQAGTKSGHSAASK